MTFFAVFTLSFGSLLLLTALIAAWLFRSASAPLLAKITVPALAVGLACAAPYQVNAMLGFPFSAPASALPQHAELIAYVAHDEDKLVDLWMRDGRSPPRAYETELDDKLKKTLREAQDRMGKGGRVMLVKGKPKKGGVTYQASDPGYELDESMFMLPAK